MSQKGESIIPPGYTLVRPISEGTFGRVLEIKESSTGKSYALKLIPRLTEADEKRGEREVSLLERFRHARIVGLHKSVVMGTYHGIVMDLGARNLKDLMMNFESRNELIPLEISVLICIDIAEGLCVMHNHPKHAMCHGDLKPDNVLLTENNRAMLCDLGAADSSGVSATHSISEVGTYEYYSPERCEDDSQRGTPACDIWSLGVMLFRMVTGEALFKGKSPFHLMRDVTTFSESKIPSTIPTHIRSVLVKLLDTNPASRLTATQLFTGRQLERVLGPATPLSRMKDLQIRTSSKQPKPKTRNDQNSKLQVMKEEEKKNQALLARNNYLRRQFLLITPEKTRELVAVNTVGDSNQNSREDTIRRTENTRNTELRTHDVLSAMLPSIWPRTESITSFDAKTHQLTLDSVVQTVKLGQDWRTVFTFGLLSGDWVLTIRGSQNPLSSVLLGFLRFPLPSDCVLNRCGKYDEPIGGDFDLSNGRCGTNKTCTVVGQTASILVNLTKREARLLIDGVVQPGFFTNIPCQVCLGMSTGFSNRKSAVELVHLRRLDTSLIRRPLTILRNTPDCYFGTSSLERFKSNFHIITTTSIVPLPAVDGEKGWRTVLTHPITQGVWELRIRASCHIFFKIILGYINDPLPSDILRQTSGSFQGGKGGDFILNQGRMWQSGKEFKREGTNKMCDRIGQTAAIRVDMSKREARLFVDDEEQPGIFAGLSEKVFLCISTHLETSGTPLEVMWMKRVDTETPTFILPPRTAIHTPVATQTTAPLAQSRPSVALSSSQTQQQSPAQRTVAPPQSLSSSQSTASNSTPNATSTVRTLPSNSLPAAPSTGQTSTGDRTLFVGTSALQQFNHSSATLSPSILTIRCTDEERSRKDNARSFFTAPITEGEWELKIRVNHSALEIATLGFSSAPLSDQGAKGNDSTSKYSIGYFDLPSGEQCDPILTCFEQKNTQCFRLGQTAAIRVNMEKRDATLLVDDKPQPCPLFQLHDVVCLAISTGFDSAGLSLEVMWLKRLRSTPQHFFYLNPLTCTHGASNLETLARLTAPPIGSSDEHTPSPAHSDLTTDQSTQPQPSPATVSAQPAPRSPPPTSPARQNTDDLNVGTSCLQTLDGTSHHTTDFTLTARASTGKVLGFRTAFTMALSEGEWELKIRGTASLFANLLLGYLSHPLRPNATQKSCGSWSDGSGGGFVLKTGQMWKGGEFKPAGTNTACVRVGQTAAIRVNMTTREARLFVDGEEQPGIFTDIPSPLCLALTTGLKGTIPFSVEVLWLERI
ncbi:putative serine/threonine protein kinase [Blattamonas nauphoetae]|uniref:non-specific serine/threonine protein kinase n=1 Tax=Blattamonas nauphoetae TaxID=2049346 RepID=A0ABQ9X4X1_9EUKA|nr:putative serine/threonine protein kinase [Blattamonas nauphoetae]